MNKGQFISIVDDDEAVGKATAGLIEAFGFEPAYFSSAEAFLRSYRLRDSVCLILDVQMPGMNGLELHDHLTTKGIRIPTIFITAFPDDRARRRVMKSGARAYLRKPFRGRILLRRIRSAVNPGEDHGTI